jgi:hypothetical protein
MVVELALLTHDGVNIHVDGCAIKTASNESIAAFETSAMIVITTVTKAAFGVGAQHPI